MPRFGGTVAPAISAPPKRPCYKSRRWWAPAKIANSWAWRLGDRPARQGTLNGGTDGPDPNHSRTDPALRGRIRVFAMGIWRGIGIGGILLIVLVVYLLVGRGRF